MLCSPTERCLKQLYMSFKMQGRCSEEGSRLYIYQVVPSMLLPALSAFLKIHKLGDHLPCCNAFLGEIQKHRGPDPYLQ